MSKESKMSELRSYWFVPFFGHTSESKCLQSKHVQEPWCCLADHYPIQSPSELCEYHYYPYGLPKTNSLRQKALHMVPSHVDRYFSETSDFPPSDNPSMWRCLGKVPYMGLAANYSTRNLSDLFHIEAAYRREFLNSPKFASGDSAYVIEYMFIVFANEDEIIKFMSVFNDISRDIESKDPSAERPATNEWLPLHRRKGFVALGCGDDGKFKSHVMFREDVSDAIHAIAETEGISNEEAISRAVLQYQDAIGLRPCDSEE